MRISDWSSDVCSSDLRTHRHKCPDHQPEPWRAGGPAAWTAARRPVAAGSHRGGRDAAGWTNRRLPGGDSRRDRGAFRASVGRPDRRHGRSWRRSEEHTSELQSLMRISYAVICLKKKTYYTSRLL